MSIPSRQPRAFDFYFKPRNFEIAKGSRFYRRFGMHRVSEFLATPFLNFFGLKIPNILCNPIGMTKQLKFGLPNREHTPTWARKKETLERVEKTTRMGEVGHVALGIFGLAITPLDPLAGLIFAAGNVYVAGVHRYNRARIYSILKGFSERKPKQ